MSRKKKGEPEAEAPVAEVEPVAMPVGEAGAAEEAMSFAQADIDALFGDFSASAAPAEGLQAIVEGSVVNEQRLPMLEVVCDRMLRTFATAMRALTSDMLDVSLERVGTSRLGDLVNRVQLPAMFGVVNIPQWDNYALAIVEPALVRALVDALLGGSRNESGERLEARNFTTIETALVARILQVALNEFAQAFRPVAEIDVTLERIETSPRFAAIASPTMVSAHCAFNLEINGQHGRFSFVFPLSTLDPVRAKLAQQFVGEKMSADPAWSQHFTSEVSQCRLPLAAVLAEKNMAIDAIRALKPGDTIWLDRGPAEPVGLIYNGRRLASGQFGQKGGRIAIRLDRPAGQEEARP